MALDWVDDTMIAFRHFLQTDSWEEGRKVVETHQKELLRPIALEMLELTESDPQIWFNGQISDDKAKTAVHNHLIVLRSCVNSGIGETFARLATLPQ